MPNTRKGTGLVPGLRQRMAVAHCMHLRQAGQSMQGSMYVNSFPGPMGACKRKDVACCKSPGLLITLGECVK